MSTYAMDKKIIDKGVELTFACGKGELEIVKTLINEGFQADIKYRHWKCPLMAAIDEEKLDVLQYLISPEGGGYDIDIPLGPRGETMLTLACENDNYDVVEFLLQQGADMICKNSNVYPIDYITDDESKNMAELFLKYGLDFDLLKDYCYFSDEVFQELKEFSDSVSEKNIKPAKTKS